MNNGRLFSPVLPWVEQADVFQQFEPLDDVEVGRR
jgi:hypothetical protein